MPNKRIQDLPPASELQGGDLLPVAIAAEGYDAKKLTAYQLETYVKSVANPYALRAEEAAESAESSSSISAQASASAIIAQQSAQGYAIEAEESKKAAETAKKSIEDMIVESITLDAGQPATVVKNFVGDVVKLTFGLPSGEKGDQGLKGDAGEVGPQGPKGDTGDTGPQGEQGIQGPKGDTGDAATIEVGTVTASAPGSTPSVTNSGSETAAVLNFVLPRGDTGPQGATGPQGEIGPQGPVGPKGDTGSGFVVKGYFASESALESGVPSPSAGDAYGVGTAEPYDIYIWDGVNLLWVNNGPLQGAKGDPGTAATVEIGAVTTGQPGTQASVTNSGSDTAAVLNFTIPQGAQGIQGPQGEHGIQGPQGEQGIQGPQGDPGPQGPTGPAGGYYTPAVDVSGNLTWTASETGMPALQGGNIKGPQGDTGPKGDTGDTGPQGPAGADGATGPAGPQGEPGQNATINGVTALTLTAAGGLTGTQSGSTYTIDGSGILASAQAYTDNAIGTALEASY